MGNGWIDQYSLLHFSVGVVAYFWSMSFIVLMLFHIFFEFVENKKEGIASLFFYV
jgi:Ca2+/Na+ antiporter